MTRSVLSTRRTRPCRGQQQQQQQRRRRMGYTIGHSSTVTTSVVTPLNVSRMSSSSNKSRPCELQVRTTDAMRTRPQGMNSYVFLQSPVIRASLQPQLADGTCADGTERCRWPDAVLSGLTLVDNADTDRRHRPRGSTRSGGISFSRPASLWCRCIRGWSKLRMVPQVLMR